MLAGSGCRGGSATKSDIETDIKGAEPKQSVNDSQSIQLVGGYSYFLQTDNSVAPYKKTVLNKICFEPAQMELVNDGELFCFRNTEEALTLFEINPTDKTCLQYKGTAKIKVVNLSTELAPGRKDDPCVALGECSFNEATLIEVSQLGDGEPRCHK